MIYFGNINAFVSQRLDHAEPTLKNWSHRNHKAKAFCEFLLFG